MDMYWEDYMGQDTSAFTMVGIQGETPVPITDIQAQINEMYRTRGHDIVIIVYKPFTEKEKELSTINA